MDKSKIIPQALTIAGSDSGGGAGIQADIKTMEANHVFSTNVIVGITAQNTIDVQNVFALPANIINQQFSSVIADFEISATKTGALFDNEHVKIIVDNIKKYNLHPLIVDPVMVAKGGAKLLSENGIKTIIKDLVPLADIVTPNLPEAEVIVNFKLSSNEKIKQAAHIIHDLGAKNVIIKGGHSSRNIISDYVLLENGHDFWLNSKKYHTKRKHGTGDTLSSAIVAGLAKGKNIREAIFYGKKYIDTILKNKIIVGNGHGPLNHWGGENKNAF
ncbi:bifunctional hydroxymethylpyrimidine kinase/phosphomethylpyrimidine kinase [Apilactobacillus quenuiae]|uniref:bifunctional hydroxymethylpyrimidine kinase/phosphomethylpyrimidine kinase n=1 Tax=Apilactobacillus quenuiae TaxID=2008377 RepID=UPI000D021992|nr:bifunctional hydroxymethylpyrimidine kinase/phosphomethylpyrimidine kinase [Apilactobacillus quenuiae]